MNAASASGTSAGSAARAASVETSSPGITRIASTPSGGVSSAGIERVRVGAMPLPSSIGSGADSLRRRAGGTADDDPAEQRRGDVVGVALDLAVASRKIDSREWPSS